MTPPRDGKCCYRPSRRPSGKRPYSEVQRRVETSDPVSPPFQPRGETEIPRGDIPEGSGVPTDEGSTRGEGVRHPWRPGKTGAWSLSGLGGERGARGSAWRGALGSVWCRRPYPGEGITCWRSPLSLLPPGPLYDPSGLIPCIPASSGQPLSGRGVTDSVAVKVPWDPSVRPFGSPSLGKDAFQARKTGVLSRRVP